MRETYSVYEAKARLSAILRRVGEGHRAIITMRGRPVAEIRALDATTSDLDGELEALVSRGIVVRPSEPRTKLAMGTRRRGALARFLAERE